MHPSLHNNLENNQVFQSSFQAVKSADHGQRLTHAKGKDGCRGAVGSSHIHKFHLSGGEYNLERQQDQKQQKALAANVFYMGQMTMKSCPLLGFFRLS